MYARLTVGALLRAASAWLRGQGDDDARLDVELLLGEALGVDRAGLYARFADPIERPARSQFESLLARHANGEPVAYILGRREFYGLSFVVRPGVLVPRHETELLVDEVLQAARSRPTAEYRVVDVGTGSGAIAVAVAVALRRARVLALDVSAEAADVAAENARGHGVRDRVDLAVTDLLGGVGGRWDAVVGNLPYIPSAQIDGLDRSVRDWEPRLALDGGVEGLTLHERLLDQVRPLLAPGAVVALEVADDRGEAALALFQAALPEARVDLLTDVFGRDRVVRAMLPP